MIKHLCVLMSLLFCTHTYAFPEIDTTPPHPLKKAPKFDQEAIGLHKKYVAETTQQLINEMSTIQSLNLFPVMQQPIDQEELALFSQGFNALWHKYSSPLKKEIVLATPGEARELHMFSETTTIPRTSLDALLNEYRASQFYPQLRLVDDTLISFAYAFTGRQEGKMDAESATEETTNVRLAFMYLISKLLETSPDTVPNGCMEDLAWLKNPFTEENNN